MPDMATVGKREEEGMGRERERENRLKSVSSFVPKIRSHPQ